MAKKILQFTLTSKPRNQKFIIENPRAYNITDRTMTDPVE